ncbi:MAG: hypothetical protein BMS9Abin14_152 [Gammaproteobacteria bacterium]|nr:MAG: hypothetical protein BMS9Abin14_152 [Gammaproteobacteria bacterium]
MRVAHLVQFFEPTYTGGIQRYVGELARRQSDLGIDVTVLTVALPARYKGAVSQQHAERWHNHNSALRIIRREAWAVRQRTPIYPMLHSDIRQLRAEVIHLHVPSPLFEFSLLLAPRCNGRLVLTVHNSFPCTTLWHRWLGRVGRRLLHTTLDKAEAIIAPHVRFMEALLPARVLVRLEPRLIIIAPGVDRNVFQPRALARSAQTVLFVAHLRPEKGLHVLIEAMKRLPGLHLQVMVSVSYEASYYQDVRRLAEATLGARVSFVLDPEPQALSDAYNQAACVVVPSLSVESWNLVLLEAAQCGAACVVTDIPGLAWADFAVRAPVGDAAGLARAIRSALGRREQLGARARESASRYSWERTCEETLAVYQALT